nr:enolase C-terminal domain-like protein [Streptosporangium roseum]
MKITGIELRRIAMPLVAPFRTSFGTETERDVLLLRVVTPDAEGWAECVAMSDPLYSPEYVDGAADVLRRFLIPALPAHPDAHTVGRALHPFKGHRMAKAALETAVLDAQLRTTGQSLAAFLGAAKDRVPSGVSVGIMDSIPHLLDTVGGYLHEGYLRIKLKIEPGWDVAPVRAVRERFGDDLLLQVDANAAYTLTDAPHLAKLDDFGLLLIEQPLANDDLVQHARLAKRLARLHPARRHLRLPPLLRHRHHHAVRTARRPPRRPHRPRHRRRPRPRHPGRGHHLHRMDHPLTPGPRLPIRTDTPPGPWSATAFPWGCGAARRGTR